MLAETPQWLLTIASALGSSRPVAPAATVADNARDWGPASPAVLEAARARLARHGPAVMHERGDDHTVVVGAILYRDFALEEDEALPLAREWNATCLPPWDEDELLAKIANGARYGSGPIGAERAAVEADAKLRALRAAPPGDAAPFVPQLNGDYAEAASYVLAHLRHGDAFTLRKWNGEWYHWTDPPGCYRVITVDRLETHLAQHLGCEDDRTTRKLVAAVKVVPGVLIDEAAKPSWLVGEERDPRDYALTPGGLLHLPSGDVAPATPDYFCCTTLGVTYDPLSPPPSRWLQFLQEVLPGDPEAVSVLQEFFGYCLVPDVRQQKILYLYGPIRCGKGTIMDVLCEMVGPDNWASPTLDMLGTNFGMAPLIDKLVATVPDARLDRLDAAKIGERLLMVSGADKVTVDRKYLDHWRGRLSARFVISSNDLLSFVDSSAALASRMIVLHLPVSFEDREDPLLKEKVLAELPGILLWSIEGWRRLRERGYFVQPATSRAKKREMTRAASSLIAWIDDRAVLDPEAQVPCDAAHGDFVAWAERTHHAKKSSSVFGKDLPSAAPGVKRVHVRHLGKQVWVYRGLRLKRTTGEDDQ